MVNSDLKQATYAAGLMRGQSYALEPLSQIRRRTLPLGKNFFPISCLLLASLLFGASIIFAKLSFSRVPVSHVVLWRFIFASLCLLPSVLTSRVWVQRRDLPRFFLVGLLELPLTYLLQFTGFAHTSATHGAFILGLTPCVYAVAAFLVNKEVLRPSRWCIVALSALGAGLIADQAGQASHWLGDGLILLSLLTSVSSVLLSQRLLERYPPLVTTAYSFWFGLPTLAPVVFYLGGAPALHLPVTVWASLLGQGVLCTALAYCLWNFGISRLTASQVGIYANLEPVIGVALGVLVLKEMLNAATLLGGLLVIGAALFV